MSKAIDVQRLRSNIAWAVAHGLGSRDLVPMLEQLIQHADVREEGTRAAKLQLAELVLETAPWRAAVLTKSVLRLSDVANGWGILALAQTLLGNYRCARTAYQRALALEPGCASYAHNLGHLLDVAFDEPLRALRWLSLAHANAPNEPEIGASYAHALARSGGEERAVEVLHRSLGVTRSGALELLQSWLPAGAAAPQRSRRAWVKRAPASSRAGS